MRRDSRSKEFQQTLLPMPAIESSALIRVVGVGGGGSNAVDRMIEENIGGVEFIAMNTDGQALMRSRANNRLRLGDRTTRGLGAGGDPKIGEKAGEESIEEMASLLEGSDMVFITAGMGGGTGTGAIPLVAEVARDLGALTIGVVTKPFSFEAAHRYRASEEGIERLKKHVDTLIVIPNDKLLEMADRRITLVDSFRMADDVLRQGIQGISELITIPGLINLDFADVKTIMSLGGAALMAVGHGTGEDKAILAAEQALSSRLLDISIDGARGVLFNITGGPDLGLVEINQAASIIRETADPDVNMIFGAVIDEAMEDKVRLTVIATGFERTLPQMNPFTSHRVERRLPSGQPVRESEPVAAEVSSESRPTTQASQRPVVRINDLDVPTFLRKRSG